MTTVRQEIGREETVHQETAAGTAASAGTSASTETAPPELSILTVVDEFAALFRVPVIPKDTDKSPGEDALEPVETAETIASPLVLSNSGVQAQGAEPGEPFSGGYSPR
jgi:hypothetical protein